MVQSIELDNFRSYAGHKFALSPDLNLIVGPNGSGKTNLLESLYVLASTRSFRAKDNELVRHGSDFYRLAAQGEADNYSLALQLSEGQPRKKAALNGTPRSLFDHVGRLQVALFEPGDLLMVTGSPELRRRFLDHILALTDRSYFKTLSGYRRILRQRNSVLSQPHRQHAADQLFAWDVQLTQAADDIQSRRRRLLEFLAQRVEEGYRQITGQRLKLELAYLPSAGDPYRDNFLQALTDNVARDLAAGFTTIGPHREDVAIRFAGSSVSGVASRGEVRTLVLALKLAELEFLEAASGQRPLLLLDDVFSELDEARRRYLARQLTGYQTVITATDAEGIKAQLGDYNLIETTKLKQYAK